MKTSLEEWLLQSLVNCTIAQGLTLMLKPLQPRWTHPLIGDSMLGILPLDKGRGIIKYIGLCGFDGLAH